MSSCQDGLDTIGHLANWLDHVNPNIETKGLGRASWGRVELDLFGGLGTGHLCFVWLTQFDLNLSVLRKQVILDIFGLVW